MARNLHKKPKKRKLLKKPRTKAAAQKLPPGSKHWRPKHGRYSVKARRRIEKPKKAYAGNRGPDSRPRIAGKRRKRMAELGLVEPVVNVTKRQLQKLQKEWYEKLKKSGFEDQEATDFRGPEEAALKAPTSRARPWKGDERQLYYYMARHYYTHKKVWKPLHMRTAWRLHSEGKSYREILEALNARYNYNKSIYTLYYEIEKEAKKCLKWNQRSKYGTLNERTYDTEMDSPLAGGWGMRLAEGFWEDVPDGFLKRRKD